MKIAVTGRTEILYDTVKFLIQYGHEIVCVVTAKETPKHLKTRESFSNLAELLGVLFSITSKILTQQDMLNHV